MFKTIKDINKSFFILESLVAGDGRELGQDEISDDVKGGQDDDADDRVRDGPLGFGNLVGFAAGRQPEIAGPDQSDDEDQSQEGDDEQDFADVIGDAARRRLVRRGGGVDLALGGPAVQGLVPVADLGRRRQAESQGKQEKAEK